MRNEKKKEGKEERRQREREGENKKEMLKILLPLDIPKDHLNALQDEEEENPRKQGKFFQKMEGDVELFSAHLLYMCNIS